MKVPVWWIVLVRNFRVVDADWMEKNSTDSADRWSAREQVFLNLHVEYGIHETVTKWQRLN